MSEQEPPIDRRTNILLWIIIAGFLLTIVLVMRSARIVLGWMGIEY